jgi:lipopolysaccharide export system protein LptA
MKLNDPQRMAPQHRQAAGWPWHAVLTWLCLLLPVAGLALESDRQQPLEVNADTTSGTLGDGVTTLTGNIDIRQGSLRIRAEKAEVEKTDGRVSQLTLTGTPALLEQEIEEQGPVKATARVIVYQVATGLVTLTGNADVEHPQYEISGELLNYDLNKQHFQGDGNGNGRIRIRLEPETVPGVLGGDGGNPEEAGDGQPAVDPDSDALSGNETESDG